MSRAVYGRVYELNLRNPAPDEEHPYVGMTTTTIHRRVHGSAGHTSPADVAKDPWKARILPGTAGYRLLETVYSTGNPVEDNRTLRRAEAYWIDRLRPKHNDVRPIRPFADEPQPARRTKVSKPVPQPRRRARRSWGSRIRITLCLAFIIAATAGSAWLVAGMRLPWPLATWIAAPTIGIVVGWAAFWRLHRAVRKLVR